MRTPSSPGPPALREFNSTQLRTHGPVREAVLPDGRAVLIAGSTVAQEGLRLSGDSREESEGPASLAAWSCGLQVFDASASREALVERARAAGLCSSDAEM